MDPGRRRPARRAHHERERRLRVPCRRLPRDGAHGRPVSCGGRGRGRPAGLPGPARVRAASDAVRAARGRVDDPLPDRCARGVLPRARRGAPPREAARRALQPGRRATRSWPRRSPGPWPGSAARCRSTASPARHRWPRPPPTPACGSSPRRSPIVATSPTARSSRAPRPARSSRSQHEAAAQAVAIATDGAVAASDRSRVPIRAESICCHGDTPGPSRSRPPCARHLAAAKVEIRAG